MMSLMVSRRVQQGVEARALAGRYRNHRNTKHFRQAVQINFHTAFFDNIHHIQRQYDRLAQFQDLQGQIQVPFQTGSIDDIYDDIDFRHFMMHYP